MESDSEISEFEEFKAEPMSQISKSLQKIQVSMPMMDNCVADQKIQQEKEPSVNKYWNIEEAEGNLEFGADGLVTAKGCDDGLVGALEFLPFNNHGIVYFELKIVDIPKGCGLEIGISQKTMAMSSFSVFKSAYCYKNNWGNRLKGDVIGCGIKFCAGKMFITWNGIAKMTTELAGLKLGEGVDQKLAIKLCGEGCSVQLGRIEMSGEEGKCPF